MCIRDRYKSTLQISKELGGKYDSVLAFVREVQEIAEKIDGKISLKDLIEIDEIYITAGEKGIRQSKPRRRGLRRMDRVTYDGDKPPDTDF